MRFQRFFELLSQQERSPRVLVSDLQRLIDTHHAGVGQIRNQWFPDFEGAAFGNFIWLEEERTSPHEEPFSDARVFVNDRFRDDREMVRIIAAKETMHVFDSREQQTRDPEAFKKLLQEIASKPMQVDTSLPYAADREALWKAVVCLVPPWLRDPYLEQWNAGSVKSHELAVRWSVPTPVANQAMNPYYEEALKRFEIG